MQRSYCWLAATKCSAVSSAPQMCMPWGITYQVPSFIYAVPICQNSSRFLNIHWRYLLKGSTRHRCTISRQPEINHLDLRLCWSWLLPGKRRSDVSWLTNVAIAKQIGILRYGVEFLVVLVDVNLTVLQPWNVTIKCLNHMLAISTASVLQNNIQEQLAWELDFGFSCLSCPLLFWVSSTFVSMLFIPL